MSAGNLLETPKKIYLSSDSRHPSCCRLCGSVKDVKYCKNLFAKANKELLTAAEDVYGRPLPRKEQEELRPHLLCRPCERRLKNYKEFRAMITESQNYFERSERVKRCIDVSPSAPRTLKSAKDQKTSRRGLSFAVVADEEPLSEQTLTENEVRKGKYIYIVPVLNVLRERQQSARYFGFRVLDKIFTPQYYFSHFHSE